ncbi:DALR anticodon binding domain containing protein [Histomonas meleagridis]|nr:DALR anticodon binding domain containing protein [Histomonas meleagridis]
MKIDQLIGSVYAVMNTFNEAQKNGFKLSEFNKIVFNTKPKEEDEKQEESKEAPKEKKGPKTEAKTLTAEEQEAQLQAKREDLIQTGASLYTRYPEIYTELANAFRDDESVQILGAALNKAYENRDTLIFKGKIEKKKYKYCGMEKLLI